MADELKRDEETCRTCNDGQPCPIDEFGVKCLSENGENFGETMYYTDWCSDWRIK